MTNNPLINQLAATDLHDFAQLNVTRLATAFTQATTKEVRRVFREQLGDAITFYERVKDYLTGTSQFSADLNVQIAADLDNADKVLNTLR